MICVAHFKEHASMGNEVTGGEYDALNSGGHISFCGYHLRFGDSCTAVGM